MMADQAVHDEIVLFAEKPNAFRYAVEVTRYPLIIASVIMLGGIPLLPPSEGSRSQACIVLLIAYLLLGLVLFMVAFVVARCLTFVVTNGKAIVRFSFWRRTIDGRSITVEAVELIEIISQSATYGSVYLKSDKALPWGNSKGSELDYLQPGATRRVPNELTEAPGPIERPASFWGEKRTGHICLDFTVSRASKSLQLS
jgi:hypothetical protein